MVRAPVRVGFARPTHVLQVDLSLQAGGEVHPGGLGFGVDGGHRSDQGRVQGDARGEGDGLENLPGAFSLGLG